MSKTYKIAGLPGDGIGREVIPQAVRVIEACSKIKNIKVELRKFECGGEYYLEQEREWSEKAEEYSKKSADAILLGAVGAKTEKGLVRIPDGNMAGYNVIMGLRQGLDLYANVRPAKLFPGVPAPLKDRGPKDIDMVIVRENTEGLYIPARQRISREEGNDIAIDMRVITTQGSERVTRYAFELAQKRNQLKRVTCVDKSNLLAGCRLFRETFDRVGTEFPEIQRDYAFVDAWTLLAVRDPTQYDVMVAPNAFGDIISDLASALVGGLGLAASGNIGQSKALFEPVHGSAPDIAGKGIANPMAAILSVALMFEWLGERHKDESLDSAAGMIRSAVQTTLSQGNIRTEDLCSGEWANIQPSSTEETTSAIIDNLR